ncbi:hypothetical protein Nos7524_2852 [Nostoc sp. PCC 7524]|uniref:helix-turn-helix domain-containing protein n=1 Tax=Nostoc sp. (strain ATCC 29411 / PCC 7524) TaxID=28072 RepID=UPI00029EEED9|nr:RodZ domain-containing protein [Nostoc sp. PCC 7524]AFY48670.1 hypothetical protein Nos7524_2852 [Nostoc sp. PCC 7524]
MKLLNEAQEKQLREISQYLLQVRQEKSIRIEEVAAKTHIRLSFLKALDAGQFEELPEPIYVQGFIRRYADTLGLDGAALANSFKVKGSEAASHPESQNEKQNVVKIPNIRIPLVVPYVLLLGLAAIGLIYILNPKLIAQSSASKQDSLPSETTQTPPAPVASTPLAEAVTSQPESVSPATPPTTPSPVATPSSESPSPNSTDNSKVKVSLELQGESWLQVTADGKTEFVGNLTTGEQRTWSAEKQLTLRSGNAGAVLISVDEQPAQPLGGQGEVKQVTYLAEGNRQ